MKLSDYIIKFIESKADSVFLVSGGGVMHVVDSIGKSKLKSYCCHHEQGAAKAAEGYARKTNKPGFCVVTTGPGGTNAITGVAASWIDNIPLVVISGQVRIPLMVPKSRIGKLRQMGPQEINITDLVKPITKYAVTITDPTKIRLHLEKAYHLAITGKPGPVWLDIPLDVQNANIEELEGYKNPPKNKSSMPVEEIRKELESAKRPLLIVGGGVWLAHAKDDLNKWINKTQINVVTAMSGDDLIDNYPHYLGTQGLTGIKSANYAMDNCDLLLIVGTRMQIRNTSFDFEAFKKNKKIIMVDIDEEEFDKINIKPDIKVHADAKDFLETINKETITLSTWDIKKTKLQYEKQDDYIDIYQFFDEFNKYNKYDVITSNGMTAEATSQALVTRGTRKFTNTAFGEMGHGLPTAIGVCAASNKPVVCFEGDGSIMMNIQELQTIKYNTLPVTIFIFNNGGYYSIRNTHKKFFGKVFAADKTSGISFPNWQNLAKGWGFEYESIKSSKDLTKLKSILKNKGPMICELKIDPHQKMLEKWSAGSLHDPELLTKEID